MDRSLLDTDTWSEMARNANPNVATRAAAYRGQFGRYTLFTLTIIEVVRGLHKRQREARIQRFLTALATEEVLTLDEASAELAGRIDADLEREKRRKTVPTSRGTTTVFGSRSSAFADR